MHLLITRPLSDANDWRTAFEARGAMVSVDPLLTIDYVPPADLQAAQAVIATSRNALRALAQSPVLAQAIRLPIFTVGPATTALARDLGFTTIHEGPASARDLVPIITRHASPAAGRLLHLSGDKIAFDLGVALVSYGFETDRLVVYRSTPATAFCDLTRDGLSTRAIDTVMLMSPLTAKTFVTCAREAGLFEQCQRLVYVCLSNNVACALVPLVPARLHIASEPNSQAVFTLIETLLA